MGAEEFLNELMKGVGLELVPAPLVLRSLEEIENHPPKVCRLASACIDTSSAQRLGDQLYDRDLAEIEERYHAASDLAEVDVTLGETMQGWEQRLTAALDRGDVVVSAVDVNGRARHGLHQRGRRHLEIWGAFDAVDGVFRLAPVREDVDCFGEAFLLARVDKEVSMNSASMHGFLIFAAVLNWMEELGDDALEKRCWVYLSREKEAIEID